VYVLLEAAKKRNIKRFIQISTDETYGSIRKGSFLETSTLHPNSPYSAAKAGGDHLAMAYYTTFKLPVIVTRSSNNFGPYQYPEKVIPLFITNLLANKKVPLYGDGLNVRDWLYVFDNCDAIDLILHKGKIGEIYNIGGSFEIPNIELTNIILKFLGKTDKMINYVPDRLGHDRRYSLDSSKIRKLGWRPSRDFNTAIKETINWYKANTTWWQKLKA
jgi:dTDP-glucose 4,6-dehydratase